MYSNEKAWDFVARIKMSAWEYSVVDVSKDFLDSMDASPDARKTLTTIMCDHGTKQGTMSKNITNNFAREVKPIQLRHFFNIHACNHDNIDLFYYFYVEKALMQKPEDFYFHNMGANHASEAIENKNEWVQKWTRAEHRTFAERFVAFIAAELIFGTANQCAIQAFEDKGILQGFVECAKLVDKHIEILEDFAQFVQNDLLIRAAAPLTIRDIIRDAAEFEFKYAEAITTNNNFLDFNNMVERIKQNADKTLHYLGQPSYFQTP
jgi:ribonucleotide reductase beta subunit family protein with ferritin-like domain